MSIERTALVEHLNRIHTSGQIDEVVVSGAFEAAAITLDQQLLVVAPALKGADALDEDIGIINLKRLIQALSQADQGDVDFQFVDKRIRVPGPYGSEVRLITMAPHQVQTNLPDEDLETILSVVPESGGVPLSKDLVKGVLANASLVGAEEVRIDVSPDGGNVMVGNDNADYATKIAFPIEADEEYTLLLEGDIVAAVFSQIRDYTKAELVFTGPDSVVAVIEDGYRYIISPQDPGEDD